MARSHRFTLMLAAAVLALLLVTALVAGARSGAKRIESTRAPMGSVGAGFTYQGQLQKDDAPVNESCEMAFRLYDEEAGGDQVGLPITTTVPVADGLFTVTLNQAGQFGASPFDGDARWLAVKVRCPGDLSFADLGRQELTGTPYAHYALSAGALHGNPVSSTQPATGQVLSWDGSSWAPAEDQGGSALPPGAMVLGHPEDTALMVAGFSPTLRSGYFNRSLE